MHPDDKALVDRAFAAAIEGQCPYDIVHRVMRPDNTVRFVHEKSEDVRNESGEIVMSIGMVHDITEAKKAESILQQSERTYREIFNASHDVIFVHDMETGAIMDVNAQVTEIYGYEPDEILRMEVGELSAGMPPYSEKEASYWIQKTLEEGPQVF